MIEFNTFYTLFMPDSPDAVKTLTYDTMEAASAEAARLAEKTRLRVFVCRAMQMFETEVKVKLSTGK